MTNIFVGEPKPEGLAQEGKETPRPRFHKTEPGAPSASLDFAEKFRSDALSSDKTILELSLKKLGTSRHAAGIVEATGANVRVS
jgi:hypothetical protein